MEHDQRGSNGRQVHRNHHGGILCKAQAEEIRRDNIDQVRDNQRQAGSICDKSCSHDKGQRRRLAEPQGEQHRNHNRRQYQCCTVVSKQRSNSSAKQYYPGKQQATTPVTPAGDMQRGPFKETGLIKQQADDNHRDECRCCVPDDIPDYGNIINVDDPRPQCQ